jgi:anti-anti-sigma regulatory factor
MTPSYRSAYIAFEGPLDVSNEEGFASAFPDDVRVLDSVLLNFTRATYVDSFFLGKLIIFRRKFLQSGGKPENIVLVLPSDGPIRKAFEASGLIRLFAVADLPKSSPAEEVRSMTSRGERIDAVGQTEA